jgi:hypothetical protein
MLMHQWVKADVDILLLNTEPTRNSCESEENRACWGRSYLPLGGPHFIESPEVTPRNTGSNGEAGMSGRVTWRKTIDCFSTGLPNLCPDDFQGYGQNMQKWRPDKCKRSQRTLSFPRQLAICDESLHQRASECAWCWVLWQILDVSKVWSSFVFVWFF